MIRIEWKCQMSAMLSLIGKRWKKTEIKFHLHRVCSVAFALYVSIAMSACDAIYFCRKCISPRFDGFSILKIFPHLESPKSRSKFYVEKCFSIAKNFEKFRLNWCSFPVAYLDVCSGEVFRISVGFYGYSPWNSVQNFTLSGASEWVWTPQTPL